jgi:hypothetical protein
MMPLIIRSVITDHARRVAGERGVILRTVDDLYADAVR